MKKTFPKFAALGVAVPIISGLVAVLWTASSGNDVESLKKLTEGSEETDQGGDRLRKIDPGTADGRTDAQRPAFATESGIEYPTFVEFPDGTKVSLDWHGMPTPPAPEEPPFADDYPVLRKKAESGKAAAAFRLWQILHRCQRAYEKEEQLTNALDRIQETHQVQLPGMDEPKYVASANTRDALRNMMKQLFRSCEGLTSEQKGERSKWLEAAAFAEYPVAMMEYSSIVTNHDIGVAIDKARWEKGDAHALQSLANRYWQTYVSGVHPDNKIKSFAHLYAYTRIAEIRFERGGRRPDARLGPARQKLAQMSDRMRPAEIDEAIELAKSLLADNPACCFTF